ncbi:unnamed protein product [Amoebophrya sp. A120]|nr:unnamed protein product [Amoebophrya sp. A120]|eukprot:GSA120T00023387001.1
MVTPPAPEQQSGVKESGIRLMSRLALEYNAVNLSQGFPNEAPPPEGVVSIVCALLGGSADKAQEIAKMPAQDLLQQMVERRSEADKNCSSSVSFEDFIRQIITEKNAKDAHSQYSMPVGRPQIRKCIEEYYARWYGGNKGFLNGVTNQKNVDAEANITVTLGATEAFAVALRSVCQPGDSILVMEPYHELYPQQAKVFHLNCEITTLFEDEAANAWQLSFDDIRQKMRRCRALVLCDPHNPTGKVFTIPELQQLCRICLDNDAYLITDDIYEHMIYDGAVRSKHVLPGFDTAQVLTKEAGFSDEDVVKMGSLSLLMNSVSKSFSCTGWRVGWLICPPHLAKTVRAVHDQLVLQAPTPMQLGVESLLDKMDEEYYRYLKNKYEERRDFLVTTLKQLNFEIIGPFAAYYIFAKFRKVEKLKHFETAQDACMFLLKNCGVATVAGDTFYSNKEKANEYIRFCFCRQMDDLAEAADRLKKNLQ